MKIYNVIIEDRHTDTEAIPFFDLGKAKEYARKIAKEDYDPERCKEKTPPDGWLLFIELTGEDFIWITEHTICTAE